VFEEGLETPRPPGGQSWRSGGPDDEVPFGVEYRGFGEGRDQWEGSPEGLRYILEKQ